MLRIYNGLNLNHSQFVPDAASIPSAPGFKTSMQNEIQKLFGEPVYTYTRRQAIEDGVLVDLMQEETSGLVREAGIKYPVAMTVGAFTASICEVDGEAELPSGQSVKGRAWDVLNLLRWAIKISPAPDRTQFSVLVWNGKKHDTVRLWASCGPGDDGEPVITIMLEGED